MGPPLISPNSNILLDSIHCLCMLVLRLLVFILSDWITYRMAFGVAWDRIRYYVQSLSGFVQTITVLVTQESWQIAIVWNMACRGVCLPHLCNLTQRMRPSSRISGWGKI